MSNERTFTRPDFTKLGPHPFVFQNGSAEFLVPTVDEPAWETLKANKPEVSALEIRRLVEALPEGQGLTAEQIKGLVPTKKFVEPKVRVYDADVEGEIPCFDCALANHPHTFRPSVHDWVKKVRDKETGKPTGETTLEKRGALREQAIREFSALSDRGRAILKEVSDALKVTLGVDAKSTEHVVVVSRCPRALFLARKNGDHTPYFPAGNVRERLGVRQNRIAVAIEVKSDLEKARAAVRGRRRSESEGSQERRGGPRPTTGKPPREYEDFLGASFQKSSTEAFVRAGVTLLTEVVAMSNDRLAEIGAIVAPDRVAAADSIRRRAQEAINAEIAFLRQAQAAGGSSSGWSLANNPALVELAKRRSESGEEEKPPRRRRSSNRPQEKKRGGAHNLLNLKNDGAGTDE